MVSHGFESRQQVIICGHHRANVVIALDGKSYKIDGQGNIDALFLRPSLQVSELTLYHCSSGQLPSLALPSMRGEGANVNVRVRPA